MHTHKDNLTHFTTLRKRAQFVDIAQSGDKWISKTMIVQVKKANHDEQQIGYTITKKIFPSAVKRNRVKRRLRAAAADIIAGHGARGYDYVLIGRRDTHDAPYAALCNDLRWCLKRLGCLSS